MEDSNGSRLLSEGVINVQNVKEEIPHPVKIKCQVEMYSLSAHADHNELMDFINACDPEKVVLMHSDDRQPLAQDIEASGMEVILPMADEEFTL